MTTLLMPKATAIWLIDNTKLTFGQIAEFCGLHPLEIKGIADGEVAVGIMGENPINSDQLTKDEITRCENNPNARLQLSVSAQKYIKISDKKRKTAHYTPIAKRQDKPDAISWLIRYCPNISEQQIIKLIGTTKTTINSVKLKTHWNMPNIRPRDPVLLGLCSQSELDKAITKVKVKEEEITKNSEK